MLFRHPELLYGLFLLVIPVLVHLFQLRRFRKERFTNVKFLKKAILQTRKSSRIKKWLILLFRLLIFASLIIAFAQPYIPTSEEGIRDQETVIYLDNSHSMQAKGQKGNLLKRSIQELLEILPQDEKITFFTNNTDYVGADYNLLKRELQSLPYSSTQLDWKTITGKAENYFSDNQDSEKIFLAISDFQVHEEMKALEGNEEFQPYLVKLQSELNSNVAIDTVFISEQSLDETIISVSIRSFGEDLKDIPVSLYSGSDLLAKRTLSPEQKNSVTIEFPLSAAAIEEGIIKIEDSGLEFDNSLYFSINEQEPINVVVLGDGDAAFLERIYQQPEFSLNSFSTNQIDFSKLSQADLVILNEASEISLSLQSSLEQLQKENVFIVIIPSDQAQIENYNSLLGGLNLPSFEEEISEEKLITEIVYSHPLFHSVFEDQVQNFQYPKVDSYFRLNRGAEKILGFENKEEFLLRRGNVFLFTAALNEENSNFKNAPLIVPTFYNIGNLALTPARLYYTLGRSNKFDVSISLQKDEILKLASPDFSFIPLQQSYPNKVVINLEDEPESAGHYQIKSDSSVIKTLSFNVNRQESLLNFRSLNYLEGFIVENSIPEVFETVESKTEINALWKWFVIFALFFLLIEMLILKFFK